MMHNHGYNEGMQERGHMTVNPNVKDYHLKTEPSQMERLLVSIRTNGPLFSCHK